MESLLTVCTLFALIIHIKCYNFGFNNSYTCHCLNNERCDTVNGGCNTGCSRGWTGPSCQRDNIALDSTNVNQNGINLNGSLQFGPQLVVDGYNSTDVTVNQCSDTGFSPWAWWYIDLQQLYMIRFLKIFHRFLRLEYLKGFSVYIDNELCFKHTGDSNPPAVYPIECSRTITGRYVNISNIKPVNTTDHYLALCEVEIYVCSQGTYGSECNNFCHCSNYDKCDVITGQCPNGCQIGWYDNSCNESCSTLNKYGVGCQRKCDARQCSGSFTCDHVTGECINGCKPGYQGIDCSQECRNGQYGDSCSKQCNKRQCKGSLECHHITGKCYDGCKPGYREDDCTVDCSSGTYGDRCSKLCNTRQCKGSQECHHITGKCNDGCTPGYREDDCTLNCPSDTYGDHCSKLCNNRQCNGSQECHHISGKCNDGCTPGFREDDCKLVCRTGKYGAECSENCFQRHCLVETSPCNHINGSCEGGCKDDYVLIDCTQDEGVEVHDDGSSRNDEKDNADNSTTIIILSVIVSVMTVILLVFGVCIIIIYRKYKALKQTGISVRNSTVPTPSAYENIGCEEHEKESSVYNKLDPVPTTQPAEYKTMGSKNQYENVPNQQHASVYYNIDSGISIDESEKQQNN